jgi:hypothetical protein
MIEENKEEGMRGKTVGGSGKSDEKERGSEKGWR